MPPMALSREARDESTKMKNVREASALPLFVRFFRKKRPFFSAVGTYLMAWIATGGAG